MGIVLIKVRVRVVRFGVVGFSVFLLGCGFSTLEQKPLVTFFFCDPLVTYRIVDAHIWPRFRSRFSASEHSTKKRTSQ